MQINLPDQEILRGAHWSAHIWNTSRQPAFLNLATKHLERLQRLGFKALSYEQPLPKIPITQLNVCLLETELLTAFKIVPGQILPPAL